MTGGRNPFKSMLVRASACPTERTMRPEAVANVNPSALALPTIPTILSTPTCRIPAPSLTDMSAPWPQSAPPPPLLSDRFNFLCLLLAHPRASKTGQKGWLLCAER